MQPVRVRAVLGSDTMETGTEQVHGEKVRERCWKGADPISGAGTGTDRREGAYMARPRKGAEISTVEPGTGKKRGRGRPKGSKSGYTTSPEALMQRRQNAGCLPARTPEELAYNQAVIQHALKAAEISRSADQKDPESLLNCFYEYIKVCGEDGMRIGNQGACAALGISPTVLSDWKYGYRKPDDPRYKKLAEFISNVCAMSREQMITDGKLNPVIGIFWQRNYDRLRNDTEQQQAIQESDNGENMTSNDYLKKYGNLLTD